MMTEKTRQERESHTAPLTLIEHAEVYGPEPRGIQSVLLGAGKVIAMGAFEPELLGVPAQVVDGRGRLVVPGFVDPHEHLVGAGGEEGFGSREPEVPLSEIVCSGITTVIGLLGTDTVTRQCRTLLGKVRELRASGIGAYMLTGGFTVPPASITGSVLDDLVIVDEVIGIGEIAISDYRSSQPAVHELARIVSDAIVGGMVSGTAGVAHFHVGEGRGRLAPLRALLEEYDIPARHLYPTHINCSRELMDEAIGLTRAGCFVDTDTVDENLGTWLPYYLEHGGTFDRLTVSSDAHTPGGSPRKVLAAFQTVVRDCGFPLPDVLKLFTRNPASVLHLPNKGGIEVGMDADLVVLDAGTLEVEQVFAGGRRLVREGRFEPEDASQQPHEPTPVA